MVSTNVNLATPSHFELNFPKIPTVTNITSTNELTLNIFSSVIPGLSLDQNEIRWMAAKVSYPTGITFEPWNVSFYVDSQFKNWVIMHNWLTHINNNKDTFITKLHDYVVDASLGVMDNFNNITLKIFFKNIWPQNLSEVVLSHKESEMYLESTITFYYDRFEIAEID